MESVNMDEVLSLDESYEDPDHIYDDNDSCAVLPCVGRGVNMINISDIKLPADYYADIQAAMQPVHSSYKPKEPLGKGRAQVIKEDKMKCFRPRGSRMPNGNDLPGGDYRPGAGSSIFVEQSFSQHTIAQRSKDTSFDEDFPALSSSISDKSSVTPDKSRRP